MKKIILLLCLGFIIQSCVQSLQSDYEIDQTEETTITFGLKLPDSSTPTTRSGGIPKDLVIDDITILVFDESNKKYLYSRTGEITQTTGNDAVFTTKLTVTAKPVILHLFANVGSGVAAGNYENDFENDVITQLTTEINLTTATALPMHGSLNLATVDNTTATGQTVSLLRSVARVDVAVVTNENTSNFTLQGVKAYFTPQKGLLAHNATYWNAAGNGGTGEVTHPTMPGGSITKNETALAATVSEKKIMNQLFIYENENKTGIKNSTRVVIKGSYHDGDPKTAKTYYYPVDFIKNSTLSNVLRNYIYSFNIISVSGPGYNSDGEASLGTSSNIDVEIIQWSDGALGDIIFDGANYFSIEDKSIEIRGNANVTATLATESSIDPSLWKMAWSTTDVLPADVEYKTNTLVDGTNFTVTKPSDKKGFLTFKTNTPFENPGQKEYLHIKISNRLNIKITVNQIPNSQNIFTVDGKSSNFTGNIYHEDIYFNYQVITGDPLILWTASYTEISNLPVAGVAFPAIGRDRGELFVQVGANAASAARSGKVTVKRDDASVPESSIEVTLVQEGAPVLGFTGSPSFANPVAFLADKTNPKTFEYMVNITDATAANNYDWIVEHKITNIGTDVIESDVIVTRIDNSKFTITTAARELNAPNINGEIVVSLVRKATNRPIATAKTSVNYTVKAPASYVVVDVYELVHPLAFLYQIEVYDRNAGPDVPTPAEVPVALNWVNGKHHISTHPENFKFKGGYYEYSDILYNRDVTDATKTPLCDTNNGWRAPDDKELNAIFKAVGANEIHTDYNQINQGDIVCYLPIVGISRLDDTTLYPHTFYGSNTSVSSKLYYTYLVETHQAPRPNHRNRTDLFTSLRCVRTIE